MLLISLENDILHKILDIYNFISSQIILPMYNNSSGITIQVKMLYTLIHMIKYLLQI
jgi:hypothetical protein